MKNPLSATITAFLLLAATGCACSDKSSNDSSTAGQDDNAKVVVMNFHSKMRCATCIAIEQLTKEVLETSFQPELDNGDIALKVIDISKKENEAIADRYQITWSSLIVEGKNDGQDTVLNLTEMAFAKARTAPEEFREELKENIKSLL